jgi:hypothetical protein
MEKDNDRFIRSKFAKDIGIWNKTCNASAVPLEHRYEHIMIPLNPDDLMY